MKRLPAVLVFLLLFLSFFAGTASAFTGGFFEKRVGNFFSPSGDCAGFDSPGTHSTCRENWCYVYDCASDVRKGPNVYTYVVQNPWSAYDPLGLSTYGTSIINGGGMRAVEMSHLRAEAAHRMVSGGVDYVVTTTVENFTDPAGLVAGGVRGEFGDSKMMNASAVGVGAIALTAATIETGLDLLSGGSSKAPKQVLKTAAKELGETVVEGSIEATAKDIVEETAVGVTKHVGLDKADNGAYMVLLEDGNAYIGKGGTTRARKSARKHSNQQNSAVDDIAHWPEVDDASAFVKEAELIESVGGKDAPNLLNQIDSPGKKVLSKTTE